MKQESEGAGSRPEATTAPTLSEIDEKHGDLQPSANDFQPVRIKGEPLSAVIIRERR